MKKIIPMVMLLATACETPPGSSLESSYTAIGQEPGWIARVDAGKIAFEGDYGETKITVLMPEGRASFNGMRYITGQLTLDIVYATCTDAMSGQRYADTVTVLAKGKEYKGCGGRKLPPA